MRRFAHVLVLALISTLLLGCVEQDRSEEMFRVGTTPYTQDQFAAQLERLTTDINNYALAQAQIADGNQSEAFENAATERRRQIFEMIMMEQVFLQEARLAGVGVDDDTNADIERLLAFNNFNAAGDGTTPTYADYDEFASNFDFKNYRELRAFIMDLLIRDEYAQQISIEGIPQKARLRHILITVPENATPEQDAAALAEAERLIARINAGEDFGDLANTYSDDPGSNTNGGVYDFAPINNYVPEFAQKLAELPINTVSEPVRTQFGYHIIEVLDRVTFQGFQDLVLTPEGYTYLQNLLNEYRESGKLQLYIEPEVVPLPPSVKFQQ